MVKVKEPSNKVKVRVGATRPKMVNRCDLVLWLATNTTNFLFCQLLKGLTFKPLYFKC